MADEMDLKFIPHFLWHFGPIGLVLFRQHYLFQTKTRGGEHFFFDTAHAQDASSQADLPGHSHIRTDTPLG